MASGFRQVRKVSIHVGNEHALDSFCSNLVNTTKYRWFSFLPLNVFEQMEKEANLYFVVVCLLMLAGEHGVFVGTIRAWSTLTMLTLMMIVSGTVALLDDLERGRQDLRMNTSPTLVRAGRKYEQTTWAKVRVGDILKVCNDEEIPADLVCLSSSNGKCYVSTANLDGETNLKPKVPSLDSKYKCSEHFESVTGFVEAEAPSKSIYTFNGSITQNGTSTPIGPDNLLLRGCKLKNTEWCMGLVIYTGSDTRIQMNNVGVPLKFPNLEVIINRSMWVAVILQAALALITNALFLFHKDMFRNLTYLYPAGYTSTLWLPDPLAYLLTFFVLYSNLVPVSLYATMDICDKAYATFINNDPEMNNFRNSQSLGPQTRSVALCHELGQVSFILSDKTGTLTQNSMTLRYVCIGGMSYERASAIPQFLTKGTLEYQFFECLALCHTCIQGTDGNYAGESPDEEAFVDFARSKGWEFVEIQDLQNGSASVKVKVGGTVLEYILWAVNKFDSARKRMSVLVQDPEGLHVLLVKGADTAMLGDVNACERKAHEENILLYSRKGLRSLVIGRKVLDLYTFKPWYEKYLRAQRAVVDRAELVHQAAVEVETIDREKMTIVGLTFIEDELQEGVGETIQSFREAHIKFWVLTGDNLETAKAIGFSTRVLDRSMHIIEINSLRDFKAKTAAIDWSSEVAILVTGSAITEMDEASIITTEFIRVAELCTVLIACRVTPLQKADLVKLVRYNVEVANVTGTPVTLAVGDGANDVPMIRAAQVGVGIYGKEGRQAAVAADFSIAQFKHLKRLLLLHGRWNYRRSANVVLFTFWRNAVQVMLIAMYTIVSGFSGTSFFEDTTRMTFNCFCTIPVWGIGIFDRDVSEKQALENASLYDVGRKGEDLNSKAMIGMLLHAGVMSCMITCVFFAAQDGLCLNLIGDYWSVCCVFFSVLVVNVNVRAAFLTNCWNIYGLLLQLLSFGLYGCFLITYNSMAITMKHAWMYHVPQQVFAQPMFWSCIVASLLLQLGTDYCILWLLNGARSEQPDLSSSIDKYASLTALKQQRLRSIQLAYHPSKSYLFALCAGSFLFTLGKTFESKSQKILDSIVGVEYSSESNAWNSDRSLLKHACPLGKSCEYDIVVKQDMFPPILITYRIDPFWQNFNDYIKNPALGASSIFNDTFEVRNHRIVKTDIAWESDASILTKYDISDASQSLLSWIRPGAVSSLWKRYGWLQETLYKGDLVTIVVHSNYNAAALGASKAVVLTTTQVVFGPSFANLLMFTGAALMIFGMFGFLMEFLPFGYALCMPHTADHEEVNDDHTKSFIELQSLS